MKYLSLFLIFATTQVVAAPKQLHEPIHEMRLGAKEKLKLDQFLEPYAFGKENELLMFLEEEYLFNKYAPDEHESAREQLRLRLQRGDSQEDVNRWLKSARMTHSISPSSTLALFGEYGYTTMDLDPQILRKWGKILPELVKEPEIKKYMDKMMSSLGNFIEHRQKKIPEIQ